MMVPGPSGSENGVSEVIGAVLLISLVILGVGMIAVFMFSQPPPQQIPSLNAIIWNDTNNIYLRHDGGDILYSKDVKIYVNGTDMTSSFTLSSAPTQPWTTWSIGTVLQYSKGSSPVSSVRVVYKDTATLAVR